MANQSSKYYHVFLSFRGETRNNFTCHLYEALKAANFVAFMDKSDMPPGEQVGATIIEAIENSMSSIIVFSPDYAGSKWCLDELALIMERKKKYSQYLVIPIFYDVKPEEVKNQQGSYGAALEVHKARHNDKVGKWREALAEVGDILGEHVQGEQNIFIKTFVEQFGGRYAAKYPENMVKDSPPPGIPGPPYSIRNKVLLYTGSISSSLGSKCLVQSFLKTENVVYEERNCSKEPKYLREVEELLHKDKVRLPMFIVNGKDFFGQEEVDGSNYFKHNHIFKSKLKALLVSAKSAELLKDTFWRSSPTA